MLSCGNVSKAIYLKKRKRKKSKKLNPNGTADGQVPSVDLLSMHPLATVAVLAPGAIPGFTVIGEGLRQDVKGSTVHHQSPSYFFHVCM